MKKREHRHFHKRHHFHKNYSEGCSYCGRNFEGLPHICKYCGRAHCSKHLLPENHNCQGLKNPKSFGDVKRTPVQYREKNYHYNPNFHRHHFENRGNRFKKNKFHMPRIRVPRLNKLIIAIIIAVATYFLAVSFIGNDLFLWLYAGACIYATILIYKPAFRWANRVNMANDLSFFGLRILGGAVVLIGIYFGFAVLFASLFVRNSAPITIPLVCLLLGLIALGGFIAFRTNRRHRLVGIWRA